MIVSPKSVKDGCMVYYYFKSSLVRKHFVIRGHTRISSTFCRYDVLLPKLGTHHEFISHHRDIFIDSFGRLYRLAVGTIAGICRVAGARLVVDCGISSVCAIWVHIARE